MEDLQKELAAARAANRTALAALEEMKRERDEARVLLVRRRAFSAAVFVYYANMPRDSDDRVMLIKHKRTGLWLPPGGELELGETPFEAAKRELEEETPGLRRHESA